MVGVVASAELIDGTAVRAGDALIGLPSSGLHTNGYTLARRILPEETWDQPMPDASESIGDALLRPHRSYLDEVRLLRPAMRAEGGDLRALAHITGGGIPGNLVRILPEGCQALVDPTSWDLPPLFTTLQQAGGISTEEMRDVFNLGIGYCAVVSEPGDALVIGRIERA